jgi:hypothetical protein
MLTKEETFRLFAKPSRRRSLTHSNHRERAKKLITYELDPNATTNQTRISHNNLDSGRGEHEERQRAISERLLIFRAL